MDGTTLLPWFAIYTIFFNFVTGIPGTRVNHHGLLMKNLMNTYANNGGKIRPVYNPTTVTNVTWRLLFHNLIDMDTRNQKFTIVTWLKESWIDEFLTWNASEYGGITNIQMPVSNVWVPDITLYSSVNSEYGRYKEDTLVNVHQDGLVRWLTPAIYTSSCLIRVRYFPFDTQVCVMQFASWGLNGAEMNIFPEESPDAIQDKYLQNGVWDMVSVKVKKGTKSYLCCPEPYYELKYRLIFRRRSEFYVLCLILPCVFLSSLSLMVFYLPPECGEKLTLSITNLLAMVVFQQLIAETMPPTGDDSPIIGNYFLVMIVMVCVSVVATALVIHCKYTSRPVPKRIRELFLGVLPKFVGLKYLQTESISIKPDCEVALTTSRQNGKDADFNCKNREYINGETTVTLRDIRRSVSSPDLKEIKGQLDSLLNDVMDRRADENIRRDWNKISAVIDRFLMYIFITFSLLSTSILMIEILYGSSIDYRREIGISDMYSVHDDNGSGSDTEQSV